MRLKSYSQWENRQLLKEFVGPRGQVDPMALSMSQMPQTPVDQMPVTQTPVAQPMMPQATMGQMPMAQPVAAQQTGMPQTAPNMAQATQAANKPEPKNDMPSSMRHFLDRLRNKSPQRIMAAQARTNDELQKMLAAKSKSAGSRGLWQQYTQARDARQNGVPSQNAGQPQLST